MKRIAGFTIIELLVTMVISGIVISMAMFVFIRTSESYSNYVNSNENIKQAMLLHTVLKRDVEKAEIIRFRRTRLELHNNDEIIYYDFDEEYVLREFQYNIDTFWVFITDLEFARMKNQRQIVESLQMNLWVDNRSLPVYLKKEYSNKQMYNFSKR